MKFNIFFECLDSTLNSQKVEQVKSRDLQDEGKS